MQMVIERLNEGHNITCFLTLKKVEIVWFQKISIAYF